MGNCTGDSLIGEPELSEAENEFTRDPVGYAAAIFNDEMERADDDAYSRYDFDD